MSKINPVLKHILVTAVTVYDMIVTAVPIALGYIIDAIVCTGDLIIRIYLWIR